MEVAFRAGIGEFRRESFKIRYWTSGGGRLLLMLLWLARLLEDRLMSIYFKVGGVDAKKWSLRHRDFQRHRISHFPASHLNNHLKIKSKVDGRLLWELILDQIRLYL